MASMRKKKKTMHKTKVRTNAPSEIVKAITETNEILRPRPKLRGDVSTAS
jgi:hypothetical protein